MLPKRKPFRIVAAIPASFVFPAWLLWRTLVDAVRGKRKPVREYARAYWA